MSDFLHALAERTVARAPAVRPVIAPLFASAGDRWHGPPQLTEEREVVVEERPAPRARPTDPPDWTPPRSPESHQPQPRLAPQASASSPVLAEPGRPRSRMDVERPAATVHTVVTPAERRPASPPPVVVERTILREAVAQPAVAERPAIERDAPFNRPAEPHTRIVTPLPAPTVATARPDTQDREPRQKERAEPRAAPIEGPVVVQNRRAAAEPRGPDVHITIGRVDVRAVLSTPSAPPTVPRAADSPRHRPLGLDAYLRGRQERKP